MITQLRKMVVTLHVPLISGVQMNRILERCIKECKCVDLESLCVIAEKQVCAKIALH